MLFVIILSPVLLWPFRNYFINTIVGDAYIFLFRNEEPFDSYNIITELADSKKKIIVNKQDKVVCRSIRLTGRWESKVTKILKQIIKPGDVILEIGANYGYYTLNFAHWLKGQGKVISYEANPKVFKILEQSVKLNHGEDTIQLIPLAASNHEFEAYLNYNNDNIGGGYVVTPGSSEFEHCKTSPNCVPVKSGIVDDNLKNIDHIDLLKIDAEGSEIPALMGASKLIDRSPNLVIVMEWYPSMLEKFGNANDFLIFLTSKGFKFWNINSKSGHVEPISSQELANHPYLELILSRQDLNL